MELDPIRCNIKRLRKQAGITQKEIANKLFIDERTYSKIERGAQKSLDIRFVAEIATILQTEICTLLNAPEHMEDKKLAMAESATCHSQLHAFDDFSDAKMELQQLKIQVQELVRCNMETLRLLKQ